MLDSLVVEARGFDRWRGALLGLARISLSRLSKCLVVGERWYKIGLVNHFSAAKTVVADDTLLLEVVLALLGYHRDE